MNRPDGMSFGRTGLGGLIPASCPRPLEPSHGLLRTLDNARFRPDRGHGTSPASTAGDLAVTRRNPGPFGGARTAIPRDRAAVHRVGLAGGRLGRATCRAHPGPCRTAGQPAGQRDVMPERPDRGTRRGADRMAGGPSTRHIPQSAPYGYSSDDGRSLVPDRRDFHGAECVHR